MELVVIERDLDVDLDQVLVRLLEEDTKVNTRVLVAKRTIEVSKVVRVTCLVDSLSSVSARIGSIETVSLRSSTLASWPIISKRVTLTLISQSR